MTIDTSPEALAWIRENPSGFSMGGLDEETVIALVDALEEARANLKAAMDALEPFALNTDAISLSSALGHVTREHLLAARDLLTQLKHDEYEKSKNAK